MTTIPGFLKNFDANIVETVIEQIKGRFPNQIELTADHPNKTIIVEKIPDSYREGFVKDVNAFGYDVRFNC